MLMSTCFLIYFLDSKKISVAYPYHQKKMNKKMQSEESGSPKERKVSRRRRNIPRPQVPELVTLPPADKKAGKGDEKGDEEKKVVLQIASMRKTHDVVEKSSGNESDANISRSKILTKLDLSRRAEMHSQQRVPDSVAPKLPVPGEISANSARAAETEKAEPSAAERRTVLIAKAAAAARKNVFRGRESGFPFYGLPGELPNRTSPVIESIWKSTEWPVDLCKPDSEWLASSPAEKKGSSFPFRLVTIPPKELKDSINFLISNLDRQNVLKTAQSLKNIVADPKYFNYFARDVLVLTRISMEPNHHELLHELVEAFDEAELSAALFREIVKAIDGLLDFFLCRENNIMGCDNDSADTSHVRDGCRARLKNLGSFLGRIIFKGRGSACLELRRILPKALANSGLYAVVPFMVELLRHSEQNSNPNGFQKQPTVILTLAQLYEVYRMPCLDVRLQFAVEGLCRALGVGVQSAANRRDGELELPELAQLLQRPASKNILARKEYKDWLSLSPPDDSFAVGFNSRDFKMRATSSNSLPSAQARSAGLPVKEGTDNSHLYDDPLEASHENSFQRHDDKYYEDELSQRAHRDSNSEDDYSLLLTAVKEESELSRLRKELKTANHRVDTLQSLEAQATRKYHELRMLNNNLTNQVNQLRTRSSQLKAEFAGKVNHWQDLSSVLNDRLLKDEAFWRKEIDHLKTQNMIRRQEDDNRWKATLESELTKAFADQKKAEKETARLREYIGKAVALVALFVILAPILWYFYGDSLHFVFTMLYTVFSALYPVFRTAFDDCVSSLACILAFAVCLIRSFITKENFISCLIQKEENFFESKARATSMQSEHHFVIFTHRGSKLEPIFNHIAGECKQKKHLAHIRFSTADCDDEADRDACSFFNIRGNPTLKYMTARTTDTKAPLKQRLEKVVDYQGGHDAASLRNFLAAQQRSEAGYSRD